MLVTNFRGVRTATCKRRSDDKPVQNGLALTPAQMAEMAEHGVPISTSNAQLAYEDDKNPTFDIPVENRRGADMVDAWIVQQDARNKVKTAYARAVDTSISTENYRNTLKSFENGSPEHSE